MILQGRVLNWKIPAGGAWLASTYFLCYQSPSLLPLSVPRLFSEKLGTMGLFGDLVSEIQSGHLTLIFCRSSATTEGTRWSSRLEAINEIDHVVRLRLAKSVYFAFIVTGVLISVFSSMSKRKGKKMKSSSSIEEFRAEFNIPMSIGLWFLEENDVTLDEDSPVEDELLLPKGYFEAGLRLSLPPLFRDLTHHLTPFAWLCLWSCWII